MRGSKFPAHKPEQLELTQVQYRGSWGDTTASIYVGPLVLTTVIDNMDNMVRQFGPDSEDDLTYGRLLLGTNASHVGGHDGFEGPGLIKVADLDQEHITIGRGMLEEAVERHDQSTEYDLFRGGLSVVSSEHVRLSIPPRARMTSVGGGFMIVQDLGSTNGTFRVQ